MSRSIAWCPFFLYRGLVATSRRNVRPRAPVCGKYTRRAVARTTTCPGVAVRARRPTDRPTARDRCPRSSTTTTTRRVGIERRARATRECVMKNTSAPDRGTTVAVVRAEGSDVEGKTTGLVRPRRMRCDAMRRPRAMITARRGGAVGRVSTRANAGEG